MRYRSATVADLHGLPLNLEHEKERLTCAHFLDSAAQRNLFVCWRELSVLMQQLRVDICTKTGRSCKKRFSPESWYAGGSALSAQQKDGTREWAYP